MSCKRWAPSERVQNVTRCWPAALLPCHSAMETSQTAEPSHREAYACAFQTKKKCQVITSCYCVTSDFPHCEAEKRSQDEREGSCRSCGPAGFLLPPCPPWFLPLVTSLEMWTALVRDEEHGQTLPPNCLGLLPSWHASCGASVNMAFCVCVRGQQQWIFTAGEEDTSITAGRAVFVLQTLFQYHLPNRDKQFLDSQQVHGYT